VSNVTNMDYFIIQSYFNQDLSQWCVSNITSMPTGFYSSEFIVSNHPVWGTCP